MTLEQLQQGNELKAKMDSVKVQIGQVNSMLDETLDTKIPTRVRGMNFDLPRNTFKGELNKQKTALEQELSDLETQFSAV